MNLNYIMYISLIGSSLLSLTSSSWLAIWLYMELNMLTFIAFMLVNSDDSKDTDEMMMKYFLINALSSTIFIVFVMFNILSNTNLGIMGVNLALMIKLGVAPFHLWYVDLMKKLSWSGVLVMSSVQKVIPLILLYHFNSNIIIIPVILSGFISVTMGLMQVSLKKIFAYSSVNHMSWIMFSIYVDTTLWIKYFILYSFLLTSIIFILNWFNIEFISELFKMKFCYNLFVYLIMSLMGLPPLYGFSMKWIFIEILMKVNLYATLSVLLIFSLIYTFYYLRLLYILLIMLFMELKFFCSKMRTPKKYMMYFLIIISITFTFIIMTWFFY